MGNIGHEVGNRVGNKVGNNTELLNENRQTIVAEMRNNPNITKTELSRIIGISTTAIDKNIAFLKRMVSSSELVRINRDIGMLLKVDFRNLTNMNLVR